MSDGKAGGRGGWMSLVAASLVAIIIGFSSTVLLVVDAARSLGATAAQQASWIAALCFGMAATTLILSWRFRMPVITAWSTPGAALIATGAAGIGYAQALGAFMVAGLLMAVAGLIAPLEKAIEKIPPPVAAAMLAGVLLRYALGVPGAALAMPAAVLPLVGLFFALRLSFPLYAVPVVVAAGIAIAALGGGLAGNCCSLGLTRLVWTMPVFDVTTALSLGVPLFLVTMASQNLPGFAVLRANHYPPPVGPSLVVTGVGSMLTAPFGGHQLNLAAITAALIMGPDTHPDPARRWLTAIPYFILYCLVGLAAASFVQILGALPAPLITAIAGLALFAPLMGGLATMLKAEADIETALVTFLVTASGVSVAGVGSAFWGLLAGLMLYGARHLLQGVRNP
jgi:benzoate membrane transport protein